MSSHNEFRQRRGGGSGHQRSPPSSAGSSLPRPGPGGPSPTARRSYTGAASPSMPFPAAQTQTQRSASYNASSSQGNGIPARTSYPSSSAAYNPNNGGGQYGSSNGGNYGGYGNGSSSSNNGYGNGMGSIGSHDTDNKYAKKPKRKWSDGPGGLPVFIGAVVLFVYAVLMTGLYFSNSGQTKTLLSRLKLDDTVSIINKVESLERKLEHSEATRRNAANMARDKVTGEINRLERSNKLATEQVDALKNLHLPQAHSTIEKHSRREKAFMNQVGWLMDQTRRESKRMVLERYVFIILIVL